MEVSEKVAYIKGLMNGLDMDSSKKEVKVMNAIVDVLDEMSFAISDLQDENDELYEALDAIDEDLSFVEEDFYDGMQDEDEYYDGNGVFYEIICPKCKEVVYMDEDTVLNEEIICPNCSERLEFEFEDVRGDGNKEEAEK